MSAPYVVEQQVGPHTWYVVSGEYPTAYMAKQAWENIDRKLPSGSIGLYRHGIEGENEGRLVSAVSREIDQIRRVMHGLRLAVHYPLSEPDRKLLIGRRARVVVDAHRQGQTAGRLKWRRPEERGATLDRETLDMIEPPPPEG